MPTERQRKNLRRGGIQGTAATAARARQAKVGLRDEDERLAQAARANPEAVALELHADLTVGVRKLTRLWLKSGSDPSRQLVEAWRELRMLTDRVLEYLRERGATAEADMFFGTLDARLEAMADRLGCPECGTSRLDPHPLVEPVPDWERT